MNPELFAELVASVLEASAILRGETAPARKWEIKPNLQPIKRKPSKKPSDLRSTQV